MATQSLEACRSKILTSIYGRRLGLDSNNALTGHVASRFPVIEYTSGSTGTAITPYGHHVFALTTLSTQDFVLNSPIPGVELTIMTNGNGTTPLSTGLNIKRASTAFFIESTEGSSMTTINLSSRGFIRLLGATTDRYQVMGRAGSSANVIINGTT